MNGVCETMNHKKIHEKAFGFGKKQGRALIHHLPKTQEAVGITKKIGGGISGWYSKRKLEGKANKAHALEKEADALYSKLCKNYSKVLTSDEFKESMRMDLHIAGLYAKAAKLYSLCGMLIQEAECLRSIANLGINVEGNLLTAIECERKEAINLTMELLKEGNSRKEEDSCFHKLKLCYMFMEREYLHIIRHYALAGEKGISNQRKEKYLTISGECKDKLEEIRNLEKTSDSNKRKAFLGNTLEWLKAHANPG